MTPVRALCACICLLLPSFAAGQLVPDSVRHADASGRLPVSDSTITTTPIVPVAARQPDPWRPLRIAKWSAVGASAASALYGFTYNQRADDGYERLEVACEADRTICAARSPNGSYLDPALEAEYQDVKRLDRRARAGIIGGQIGVAASVVLFILDLRNDRPPPNIPYDPRGFQLIPARDGGIQLRFEANVKR